jgi:hypothetical protein
MAILNMAARTLLESAVTTYTLPVPILITNKGDLNISLRLHWMHDSLEAGRAVSHVLT